MFNTPDAALIAVARVVGVALLLQTVELWSLRRVVADEGVWPWQIVRRDFEVFPRAVQWLADQLLSPRGWPWMLATRASCAVWLAIAPHALPSLVLLVTTVLIALRWRGSFNGGSDSMTLVLLSALSVATLFHHHPLATLGALWYIALHACNSYFLAGLIKLRTRNWRNGSALVGFMHTTIYGTPPWPAVWMSSAVIRRLSAWSVIILECAFPLSLIGPAWCWALISAALVFHGLNVNVFGLNRFLFAWVATYPALLWCSQQAL